MGDFDLKIWLTKLEKDPEQFEHVKKNLSNIQNNLSFYKNSEKLILQLNGMLKQY